MTLSVLIPCYLRADHLERNLNALKQQNRLPDQVVIAVRETDTMVRTFLQGYDAAPLSLTISTAPEVGGFSGAINAGLRDVVGEVVAVTDDDTEAFPDWLERIENYFLADPTVGGVGGRDMQEWITVFDAKEVGIVKWWGNVIGNHHIGGVGTVRPVDVLKGCNCAYRTAPFRAIGFDMRLWGKGMQMNTEVALGLCFRRAGWTLLFDPDLKVQHHAAERHDNDKRGMVFNKEAQVNQMHNKTLSLWEHFGVAQRGVFLVWSLLIGTRTDPGLVQIVRLLGKDEHVLRKARASFAGLIAGIQTAQKSKRPETLTPEQVQAATVSSVPPALATR